MIFSLASFIREKIWSQARLISFPGFEPRIDVSWVRMLSRSRHQLFMFSGGGGEDKDDFLGRLISVLIFGCGLSVSILQRLFNFNFERYNRQKTFQQATPPYKKQQNTTTHFKQQGQEAKKSHKFLQIKSSSLHIIILTAMSTSLPRIRSVSESIDQKPRSNLKFKKLKLATDSSLASLGGKKHSIKSQHRISELRTDRVSSMQRYSAVNPQTQSQRDLKNDKAHMNLLERKLLTGRYDEILETGNDLNRLKGKTDQFLTNSKAKIQETDKIRIQFSEIRREIDSITGERRKFQQEYDVALRKYEHQKKKTDLSKHDKGVYEHMNKKREKTNNHIYGQIASARTYLQKLVTFDSIFERDLQENTERCRNTEAAYHKLKKQAESEGEEREVRLQEQQAKIGRRVQAQVSRMQRNQNLVNIKVQMDKQEYDYAFSESYYGILSGKFQDSFMNAEYNRLMARYSKMNSQYSKICSYGRFPPNQPKKMSARFLQHQPEGEDLQKIIKEKEETIGILEGRKKDLQHRHQAVKSESLEILEIAVDLTTKFDEEIDYFNQSKKEQIQQLEKEGQIMRIRRWIQRNMGTLGIKADKSTAIDSAVDNFKKLIGGVKKELQRVEAERKEKMENSQGIQEKQEKK